MYELQSKFKNAPAAERASILEQMNALGDQRFAVSASWRTSDIG